MRNRGGLRLIRCTHLDRNNALAHSVGLLGQLQEFVWIPQSFDVQAKCGDTRIGQNKARQIRHADLGLIARRHQISNRQGACVHA